jgi:hypothetical protein
MIWLGPLVCPPDAHAQANPLELAVKATYLYKFLPFVQPSRPTDTPPTGTFTLCIVGTDPFGPVLDRALAGQTVGERSIAVMRLDVITGPQDCDMVFAAGSERQSIPAVLAAVRGAPVLTVTDAVRDPRAKGIINFVIVDNRVRFEIDDRAAADNGLTISSKLLSLAVYVRPRG